MIGAVRNIILLNLLNVAALIADYFALDDSEASSDDGDAGKSLCFVDV